MSIFETLQNALHEVEAGGHDLSNLNRSVLDSVDATLGAARRDVMDFIENLKAAALRNPEPIFAILRKIKPILLVKNVAVLTRFDDVQEVLLRDQIFQVPYQEKTEVVTGGSNFFLGMQNTPQYTRDASNMRIAVRREDLPDRVVPFVGKTAEKIVTASGGRMDIVQDLTRVVPTLLIADYFGAPPPSDKDLADWSSVIFQFIFTDLNNDPEVGRKARDAAAKMRSYLDQTIASRKASSANPDDVVGRCLAMQKAGLPGMDDLEIRNNLIGLIVGAIPTTSKCCAQALDQLLDRPGALAGAQAAAAAGDDGLLAKYVFEALRFNPNNPGVFRMTAEDYVVAMGTWRATRVPKGTIVLSATQSAMFDELKVDRPNEFRTDRPDYHYMHYGYGMHTCFGRYLNQVQIPGILKPLLRCNLLRRAPGDAGKLKYDGPFPTSMMVTFEAKSVATVG